MQCERHLGILGGVIGGPVERHFIETQLVRAFAADLRVRQGPAAQVSLGKRVHVVIAMRLQHVGLEQRVMGDADQPNAVVRENVGVVLQVLADLAMVRAFQPRPQRREGRLERQLLRHAGVAVSERDVAGFERLHRQGNADQLRRHRVERCSFGIDAGQFGRADALQPRIELIRRRHHFVFCAAFPFGHGACGLRCGLPGGIGNGLRIDFAQPRLEFVPLIKLAQAIGVFIANRQRTDRRHMRRQIAIGPDRHQRARRRQPGQRLAQVFADGTADLAGTLHQRIERTIGVEPLGGGLRADLVDARHVVDAVSDQRQVVDDARRRDAELRRNTRDIERFAAHRVHQRRALVDQLREVLVAGRDHGSQAMLCGLACERADDIVGLDALDFDDGPAECPYRRVDGLDLGHQIIRHGGPIRLVFGVQVVPEGLTLGIEDARNVVGRNLLAQRAQHSDESADRSGGLAGSGSQVRQRMECAV